MNRNTYTHRREGTPASGVEDLYAFAQDRYNGLLREAEDYRLEHKSRVRSAAYGQAALPFAHLLNWAKMQLTALTHAA